MIKLFLLFSICISLAYSSLIAEKRPLSLLHEQIKQEIVNILATSSIENIDYGTYEHKSEKETITFDQITMQYKIINKDLLKITISDDGKYTLSGKDDTLLIKYDLQYSYNDLKNSGSVIISTTDFTFEKTYTSTEPNIVKSNAVVILSFKVKDITFTSDTDKEEELKPIITEGLTAFVNEKPAVSILPIFNTGIETYYANQKKINKISFTSYNPEKDFELDISLDKIPSKHDDTSMIFYHAGRLSDHKPLHVEPLFSSENIYQLSIHRYLFYDFINDITNNIFDFTLNRFNRPDGTPFNLDIQSLGKIIPEVYFQYPRNGIIKVYNNITNVSYDDVIAGNIVVDSTIRLQSDESEIFKYQSTFAFKLKDSFEDFKINFYIDSLALTKVVFLTKSYTKVNLSIFKKWMTSTYSNVLSKNNQKFFKYSLDLTELLDERFYSNYTGSFNVDGYLITGNNNNSIHQEEEVIEIKFLFK